MGYCFPDGSQKFNWQGREDEGRYEIVDGQFCCKWKTMRGGEEECQTLYHTGVDEYTFRKLDGSYD